MGNVPAKEISPTGSRSRSNTYSGSGGPGGNGSGLVARRNTTSSIYPQSGIFNVTGSSSSSSERRLKKMEEKDRIRRKHCLDLIVRYSETVDGGFLAPYGTYKSNLDYNTDIVRGLIIKRHLAPFYTPLQDFDESWTDEELKIILRQLPIHSIEIAYSDEEEEDDIDNHKIHKSANYYRRQEQKAKLIVLKETMKQIQKDEEARFLEEKEKDKQGLSRSLDLASDALLHRLYRNATECPICFLYYPENLNISRCCLQPICTECFVQIKRLDPHPPHDEVNNNNNNAGGEALPHTLISESAHCPYCAIPNFGVTYDAPLDICTGIGGIKPGKYKSPKNLDADDEAIASGSGSSASPSPISPRKAVKPRRRSSLAINTPGVISIDLIRPDWEGKLASARNKLARKAATATAIHASNLLINADEESSTQGSSAGRRSGGQDISNVEQRMIEEALRLSLLDEEERRAKERNEAN